MAEMATHFGALVFSFGSKTLCGINVDLLRWGVSWIKYLDVFLSKHPAAYVIHTGTYFLGRKPDERPVGAAESDRVPSQAPLCFGQAGREDPRR